MTKAPIKQAQKTVASGIFLMAIAMLTIPLVDGLAKYLSTRYSPLLISWLRYAVACIIVLPMVYLKTGWQIFPSKNLGAHSLRTVFLVTAMTLYFLSIARISLATAVTAYFVSPIIAVMLSIVFLKEQLTLRKGVSLLLALSGAVIILQPEGTIDGGIFMAFGAGFFFALYLLATRLASRTSDPFKTLAFQCVLGAFLLLPQALLHWSPILIDDFIFFFGLGLFSVIAHLLSIMAFRFADTSTLAPVVYLELVGTVIIGYLVFDEIPDLSVFIGAILIILAGLVLVIQRGFSKV